MPMPERLNQDLRIAWQTLVAAAFGAAHLTVLALGLAMWSILSPGVAAVTGFVPSVAEELIGRQVARGYVFDVVVDALTLALLFSIVFLFAAATRRGTLVVGIGPAPERPRYLLCLGFVPGMLDLILELQTWSTTPVAVLIILGPWRVEFGFHEKRGRS